MFAVYMSNDGNNWPSIYNPLVEELTILTPKVTIEMGKAGSFSFSMPPNHRYLNQLHPLKTRIRIERDGVEIFRGRVLTIARAFNNIRAIYCEGDLAYLVDSVIKGKRFSNTVQVLFRHVLSRHNEQMIGNSSWKQLEAGIVSSELQNIQLKIKGKSDDTPDPSSEDYYKQVAIDSVADDWMTAFDYLENTIIEYCGGYLRTRHTGNNVYVDLLTDYGNTATQEIEFGKNLLDLTEEASVDDIMTVLIPIGDDNLVLNNTIPDGPITGESGYEKYGNEIVNTTAVEQFGRIVKTHVFDSVNTVSTLLENGVRFFKNHENMPITVTVKAVDMRFVDPNADPINIGDRVKVKSPPHGISDYMVATKIEYDLDNPANDTYTFGNPHQSLTQRYRRDQNKDKTKGGGAGSAASASEAAAESAYKTWIEDRGDGYVSLGALYHEMDDRTELLKYETGIDLKAEPTQARVNIYSLHTDVETNKTFRADMTSWVGDDFAKVSLQAAMADQVMEDLTDAAVASIVLGAETGIGTYINANANNISLVSDRIGAVEQSAIYLNGDSVNAVAGKFSVDSNGKLHIKSGSGLFLGESNASIGLYENGELQGGVIVTAINNGTTKIYGNRIQVTGVESIDQIVTKTGITSLTGQQTLYSRILQNDDKVSMVVGENQSGNYIKAGEITLAINNDNTSTAYINATHIMLDSDESLSSYVGDMSRVYQTRNDITNVVGKYEIVNGNLVVKDGAAFKLRRTIDGVTSEFGVFDEGNLTGGVIVKRINGNNVETVISGSKVDITANESFNLAVSDINGIKSTDLYVNRNSINAVAGKFEIVNGNLVVKDGAAFKIRKNTGGVSAEFGVWDEDNLTAGVIVDKINDDNTVKINGNRIFLNAGSTGEVNIAAKITNIDSRYTNLVNGVTTATELHATTLTASNGTVANTWSVRNLQVDSHNVVVRDIYMDGIEPAGVSFFGTNNANVDLSHHHVITAEEGTGADAGKIIITIGTTIRKSSQDNTANFSIAATQTYQNGVAAAETRGYNSAWVEASTSSSLPVTGSSPNTITATVPDAVSGSFRTSNFALSISQWNGVNATVYLRNTFTQTAIAQLDITAPGSSASYSDGWAAARSRVSVPTAASTSNNIAFQYPIATVDANAGITTYWLTVDSSLTDNTAYARLHVSSTTGTVVARANAKPLYDSGWLAASAQLAGPPDSTTNNRIALTVPHRSTVGSTETWYYYLVQDSSWSNNYTKNVDIKGNSTSGTTRARVVVDASSVRANGYNAGWAGAWGLCGLSASQSSTNTMTIYNPPMTPVANPTSNDRISVTITLTDAGVSGKNGRIDAKIGGTTYARGTVDASSIYDNGWSAAQGKVTLPSAGTSASFVVYYPVSTVDADRSSRTYYLLSDDTINDSNEAYAYVRSGSTSGTVIARRSIRGLYAAGWARAVSTDILVDAPVNTSNGTMEIKVPYRNGTWQYIGTSATWRYYLTQENTWTNNKRKIYIRGGSTGGSIRAQAEVDATSLYDSAYSSGWAAARNRVSVPTAQSNSNNIAFQYPIDTVDASAGITTYWLTVDSSLTDGTAYARLHVSSTTGTIVARANAKPLYDSGWLAASSQLAGPPDSTTNNRIALTVPHRSTVGSTETWYYYLVQDSSWSSNHTKNVDIRGNSTSGTTRARVVVDASSVYISGYTLGVTEGTNSVTVSNVSDWNEGNKTVTLSNGVTEVIGLGTITANRLSSDPGTRTSLSNRVDITVRNSSSTDYYLFFSITVGGITRNYYQQFRISSGDPS